MNILFIGDIVGRPGRAAVKKILPDLRKEYKIDFVIANGENLAGTVGMTYDTYQEMREAGIDYFTSGNHIWAKKDFIPYLNDPAIKVLRPANYPDNVPGRGIVELKIENCKLKIINLQGLVFMDEYLNNPFLEIDKILKQYAISDRRLAIVDFHAEATSEKNCLGYYLDGRVSAVVGSHTHVPTADHRILPKGTAYISDAGMVGALHSSIGDEYQSIIEHFKTALPFKGEVGSGPVIFNAVLITIDPKTTRSTNIELIQKLVE